MARRAAGSSSASGAAPTPPPTVEVSDDTLTALAPLEDGVLFASAEPAWGRLAGDGKIIFRHDRDYADFRDGEESFALSPDGVRDRVRLRPERQAEGALRRAVRHASSSIPSRGRR